MAMNKEDAEYVDQVMASQSILKVQSNDQAMASQSILQVRSIDGSGGTSEGTSETRKRRLSVDGESENGVPAKKEKCDSEFAELLRAGLTQLQHDLSKTLDQKFESFEDKLKKAILSTVQDEINGVRQEFNDRISGLTKKLEDKLSSKIQNTIDSKIKDVKNEISNDFNLNTLTADVSELQKSYAEVVSASNVSHERQNGQDVEHGTLNIVVRNMKFDEREASDPNVTINLVNRVIRDGLKLTDAKVVHAERKTARNDKPGVIIAQFERSEHKQNVLKNKKSLKKIKKYESVYIEEERSHEQRVIESNIRTLLHAVGKSKDYALINGRFVKKTSASARAAGTSSQ